MCGIAGAVDTDGRTPAGLVDTMAGRLAHRGPDASGNRRFGRCALAHTRLRIVDLSPAGDQPLANEDDSVWVVCNGEIYNFTELRGELERAGHRFRSHTDSEVLVHLYEAHGDAMVGRLRGMFAFAVWDERAQRLLLVRDRLGIKPLYYRTHGPGLRFASEVGALSEPSDELDGAAVHGFLRLGWVPGPATIRAGVRELPPGHQLSWVDGAIRVTRYWEPPPPARRGPSGDESGLREALHDAARRHLVADVPVGLFLSSGVDSAVVGSLAAHSAPDVRGYTVAFETGADEAGGAAAIARRLGIDHTVVRVGGSDVLGSLDAIVSAMDQPTVDGVNSWVVSRAVREAGPVVALSGLGGDELFGGYSTFRHVPRIAAAGRVARALPGRVRRSVDASAALVPAAAHSRARRAAEAALSGGWDSAYGAVRGLFGAGELAALCPGLDGGGPARRHVHLPPAEGLGGRAMVGRLELDNYLPYQLLRDTDCMSMAHALEVRVPLLDDRVVAVAAARLGEPGWGKERMVAAADPALADLTGVAKRTFTLPFDRWMQGPLRDRAAASLVHLGEAGLGFDRRRLGDLWFAYRAGRVGWRPVWALAVLGMWLEHHATPDAGCTS